MLLIKKGKDPFTLFVNRDISAYRKMKSFSKLGMAEKVTADSFDRLDGDHSLPADPKKADGETVTALLKGFDVSLLSRRGGVVDVVRYFSRRVRPAAGNK
mgnify:CR=1 FL=1